jgi:hypothetical protein
MSAVQDILKSSNEIETLDFILSFTKEMPQNFSNSKDLASLIQIATAFFVSDDFETTAKLITLISDI